MRRLLILVAVIGTLVTSLAGYTHPNKAETKNRPTFPTDVKYGGIRFYVDEALATEIKAETVPASLSGKPSDLWPEHVAFTLVGYRLPRPTPDDFPQLRVFSVQRFRDAVDSLKHYAVMNFSRSSNH